MHRVQVQFYHRELAILLILGSQSSATRIVTHKAHGLHDDHVMALWHFPKGENGLSLGILGERRC